MKKLIIYIVAVLTLLSFADLHGRDPLDKWRSKKPIVKEVEVIGNEEISDGGVKDAISTQEQGFWQTIGLKKKNRLRKDSEKLDGAAIHYLYNKNGFRDVQFSFEYEVGMDSAAIVKIYIEEGPQYHISNVILPEDIGYKAERIKKIASQLKPGDVLNTFRIKTVASDIKTLYANSGYPYAWIGYSLEPLEKDSTTQNVIFDFDPGPLTLFGDIKVDSLFHTSAKVVKRELTFKTGDIYSREELLESRQRIYSTGLFTYVDFKTNMPADSIEVQPDLTITCNEKKPKFIRVQTGAAQDTIYDLVWDLALETGSRNISGLGRSFRFSPSLSFRVISGWQLIEERFSFQYTEPWPFGFRMPLYLLFAWEPRVRRPERDIKIEAFRFNLGTLKEISKFTKIRTGFEFEKVNIEGIAEDSIPGFKSDADIEVGRSIWLSYDRDTRPHIFVPTSGSVTRLNGQLYGGFLGGDKNFFKSVGEWSRYLRASRWDVYAFRIKMGWAASFEDDEFIPSPDRFYLGGANTIRGYSENSVGPKDADGDPLGGKFYFLTNHEWRRYLIGKFWMSTFLDIGGIWRDVRDARIEDVLATVGLGIQYVSPLGPVRLDYGQRVAWKPVAGGGRFHISILYAF